jgi:hypothetical protein
MGKSSGERSPEELKVRKTESKENLQTHTYTHTHTHTHTHNPTADYKIESKEEYYQCSDPKHC